VHRALAPLLGLFLLLLASCSSPGCAQAHVRSAASCAAGVEYAGHFYIQWSTKLPAVRADRLGNAVHPACNDTGGCDTAGPDQPTTVWKLRGVAPRVAVVGRMQGSGRIAVFGRLHASPRKYFRLGPNGVWQLRRH